MSAAAPRVARGGGIATSALLAFSAGVLGLLGTLPYYLGPAVGAGAVVASAVWRARRSGPGRDLALAPAVFGVAVVAATAPIAASTEVFAGLTGLAFLLWLADDPDRPVGGGRRAVPTISLAALAVGLTWVITLAVAGHSVGVGVAGGLLAAGLVLLAVLLTSLPRPAVAARAR